jgi:hypothetical protein
MDDQQLYRLEIKATGEVRDKDGNLISVNPITGEAVVTEAQALDIIERTQS